MSKREQNPVRISVTKVKRRRGVGSRVITVLDSDEELVPVTRGNEYARVTKTRLGTSGKKGGVSMSSIPIHETQPTISTQQEENFDSYEGVDLLAGNLAPNVQKKQQKKINDSVST